MSGEKLICFMDPHGRLYVDFVYDVIHAALDLLKCSFVSVDKAFDLAVRRRIEWRRSNVVNAILVAKQANSAKKIPCLMTEQPEERVRGRSLLVSQLSQQKRGSYSDDDLFDEELEKDSEQPEPERPVVPTKLPRITPSVSLSVAPSTNTLSSTSGIPLDSNPVLKSLVLAPTPSVCATTSITRRIGSAPLKILPRGQPDLAWRAGRLESILLNDRPTSTQLPLGLCLPKRGLQNLN
ncbi:hypothetical protein CSKR_203498 [Clonorchis sinensis]|uniref:Uncharacterized protein n=1 Tax=Clonorchis sinensis TaxID=79923 RepID=A0A8T1MC78_CLOSI|nr:hypothetical protein CSKR_203498 [Clonorchis sinensis]